MGSFTPSRYQKAILRAVREGDRNLMVVAVAGSGKTTTLKMIANELPRHVSATLLCFNKLNAEQARAKLPGHVGASTMHSLGYRIIRENVEGAEVDTGKLDRIMRTLYGWPRDLDADERALFFEVLKLVPMCLYTMVRPLEADFWDMVDTYGLEVEYGEETRIRADKVIQLCREERSRISFDDMIDHVVHFRLHGRSRFDVVLGDEVQDWNRQQAEFVAQLVEHDEPSLPVAPSDALGDLFAAAGMALPETGFAVQDRASSSRLILVGDPRQSIYAFRGADTQSMPTLRDRFDCDELPLSVCYRCPKAVVREAQQIIGEDAIQWAPGASEGEVVHSPRSKATDMLDSLEDGDMVLCRCNAPLMSGALHLIARGRKAVVRGKDIGKNLRRIVLDVAKKAGPDVGLVVELIPHLREWADREVSHLVAEDRVMAAQVVEDKYVAICHVGKECDTVTELANRLEKIFSDDTEGVVFSSGHRAKGLEADVVVIWAPELCPHPAAAMAPNAEQQMEQERNLLYVMRTRAMRRLIYQPTGLGVGDSLFPALADAYARGEERVANLTAAYDQRTRPTDPPDFWEF